MSQSSVRGRTALAQPSMLEKLLYMGSATIRAPLYLRDLVRRQSELEEKLASAQQTLAGSQEKLANLLEAAVRTNEASANANQALQQQVLERLNHLEYNALPIRYSRSAMFTEARDRILRVARLLKPQRAAGHSKVRLGSQHDGGYVCLDDFFGLDAAFSFGIEQNASWDSDAAVRGLIVHQFDHTVDGVYNPHPNFRFQKKKISAEAKDNEESIPSLLRQFGSGAPASVLLKIDIEYSEWPVFDATPADDLNQFSQIICEFHGLCDVLDDAHYHRMVRVLEKLDSRFGVVHVHGNNFSPYMFIGNVPFPPTMEVTLANRSRYQLEPTDEIFPTGLDNPCDASKPDHFLGRFQFA